MDHEEDDMLEVETLEYKHEEALPDERTKLFEAIEANDKEAVRECILQNKNLLEERDKRSDTPLLAATKLGHEELVYELEALGANVHARNSLDKYTGLHLACKGGNINLVRFYLQKGLNANDTIATSTPVHLAVTSHSENAVEILRLLVDHGADIDVPMRGYVATPLMYCCTCNGYTIAKFLIEKGADVNAMCNGETALMIAARRGSLRFVELIVESGRADLTLTNSAGQTALDIANANRMSEVATYLWRKGCENTLSSKANQLGKFRWTRPYVKHPQPPPRNSPAGVAVGSKFYIFGGKGIAPLTRTAIPLHDFWCIDFDECEIANITMPNGLFYNPDFKLDKKKCSKHLIVSDDGLTVESIQGPDCKPAAVKATLPFVPAANYSVAYFEVTILDVGESRLVTVGLTDESFPVDGKHPGWISHSFGYHGDDGNAFHNSGHGAPYGDRFENGDVVGCGVNFDTGEVFFTLNGNFLGVAFKRPSELLYPTISMRNRGAKVKVNFGAQPFHFDFNVPTLTWKSLEAGPPFFNLTRFLYVEPLNSLVLINDSPETWVFSINDQRWEKKRAGHTILSHRTETSFAVTGYLIWAYDYNRGLCCVLDTREWKWSIISPRIDLSSTSLMQCKEAVTILAAELMENFKNSHVCTVEGSLCFFTPSKLLKVNPDTFEFHSYTLSGPAPSTDQIDFSIVTAGSSIFVLGGWDDNQETMLNDLYVLDTKECVWFQPHTYGCVPRSRGSSVSGLIRTTTTKLSERYDVAELLEMLPGSSGISKQVKQYVMNAFGWSGTDCMFDFELLELGTLNSKPKLEFDELEKYLDVPSSGCDVTLQFFSGQSIQAHRIVLASRSKYFRDLFTSTPTPPSVIPVQENYELFACLLHYLYSDVVDVRRIKGSFRDFMQIVEKYSPNHSERIIQEYILTRVTIPSTMSSDFKFAVGNELFADIAFNVDGVTFKAHKVILAARSSYFAALFYGGLAESQQSVIELPGINPQAFKHILEYLYTKSLDFESSGDHIADIFILACQYNIKRLQHLLEEVMVHNLTHDNVISLLLAATQQHATLLMGGCLKYIHKHRDELQGTAEYEENKDTIESLLSNITKTDKTMPSM